MISRMFNTYPFFVLIFATVLTGCASIGAARRQVGPPFRWDNTSATPDIRLTIEEKDRTSTANGTLIQYQLESTGFSAQEPVSLWRKMGTHYNEIPAALRSNGLVQILSMDTVIIGGFVPGQALDLALASKTADKQAYAKVIPFPIQAQGNGGCSASAEIETETGLVFLISLKGFQPAETVQTTSQYNGEAKTIPAKISERGELQFPVLFARGSRGKANFTAKGEHCTVSLDYNIGKDALAVQ
jgi:hypothetical protein